MRGTRTVLSISLLSCLVIACQGDKGAKGDPGDPGQPGQPAPTTGTLTGSVSDGIAHDALGGVAVTASDAGGGQLATTTTGADGKFSVTVTAGPVDLTFDKADYTSPGVLHSGVGIGETVQVVVTMNESSGGAPSVSLAVPSPGDDFGYGAVVNLTAAAADPNGDALSYTWTNATDPALDSAVAGSGADGTVTMPSLEASFGPRTDSHGLYISGTTIDPRFGVIPITSDTRGTVTAKLTVSDGRGQAAVATIALDAASRTTGLRDQVLGQLIYVNCGTCTDGEASWTLTAPEGSTVDLSGLHSAIASFRPDIKGKYTISEASAGKSIDLYADTYYGMIGTKEASSNDGNVDQDCLACHSNPLIPYAPNRFTAFTDATTGTAKSGWSATAHATTFTRGINGTLSNHFSGACTGCHTTGHDAGVPNGGFADVAARDGWNFPSQLAATNWQAMLDAAPAVARLANIQCESCHGPQGGPTPRQGTNAHGGTEVLIAGVPTSMPFQSPRISYSAETCGFCHAAGSDHIYTDWATASGPELNGEIMAHSSRNGASHAVGGSGLNTSCGRCHSAQGFTLYAGALLQGKVTLASTAATALVTPANVEPVTCVGCHDPHDATNPNQLRFYGDTPKLPAGFAAYGMGKGAVCITCHNSRNATITGSSTFTYLHEDGETYNSGNPTSYSAPHQADQGDVFVGHNAYFMGANMPMLSRHAAITDTCVGCHMTLQPEKFPAFGAMSPATHLFRITDENEQQLCANCHGSAVNGAGIQAQVEAQLLSLNAKMGQSVKAKNGGVYYLRAWDEASDLYSSWVASGTAPSNLQIDTTANPIVSVAIEEIHGQIGLVFTMTNPVTIQYVNSTTGAPVGSPVSTTTVACQLGAFLKSDQTNAVYPLSGNFVRAGWNYFLIEGDQSKGLHNPSFVTAVLNNSLAKDLTN